MTVSPGIRVLLTIADLDRLNPLPCIDACPVCGSDQVHGQACIASRLFRTITRLGDRGIRKAEIAAVDAGFLKARGINHNKAESVRHTETGKREKSPCLHSGRKNNGEFNRYDLRAPAGTNHSASKHNKKHRPLSFVRPAPKQLKPHKNERASGG